MQLPRKAGGLRRTALAPIVFMLAPALSTGCTDRKVAPPASVNGGESAGGTGSRAKGEEGAMGSAATAVSNLAPRPTEEPAIGAGQFGGLRGSAAGSAGSAGSALSDSVATSFGISGLAGGTGTDTTGTGPRAGAGLAGRGGIARDDRPPVRPAKLDPNARYATTYRPGGAALAAFDAAVARGQIPASYQDLVGAFGGRYAPNLPRPTEGALAVAVSAERGAVGPAGGPLNVRVSLVSSDAAPPRAPLSVHLVLDTSGSMAGKAIDDARRAAEAVVAKLAYDDDFSMVTFSDRAHLLVPDAPIGPRRGDILSRIEQVQADGGTNISSGLDEAYAEAHDPHIRPDAVRIVMLLSDGHANGGDTSPQSLARRAATAFQDGVQTSTFGLGDNFDAALMSRIADRGAGGYYYLADSSQIEPALSREIDARLQPVATAVELRVRLRPDIAATKVFGSRELTSLESAQVRQQEVSLDRQEQRKGIARDRQADAEGGMRFFIPAFARSDTHSTMVTLNLPPGAGQRAIASVELRYKDRLLGRNVTREVPMLTRWAQSDAESAQTADESTECMAQAFAAGETILAASERVDAGDRPAARGLLEERVDVLRRAAESLHEPRLAEDAVRLARLAAAVGSDGGVSDPLSLVVMLRGSGYGYL